MQNIFIDILPPWVETGLQPAFYDLESGTVLQQTARMYAKVRELNVAFNTFSENVTNEINRFEQSTNDEIERFENDTNDEIERFEGVVNATVEDYIERFNQLHDYVEDYFENLDVQEEINNKIDEMVEEGTFDTLLANYLVICGANAKELGCKGDGVTDDTQNIQNAIDHVSNVGVNKLVFPSGEYVISGEITLPSNFELVGMEGSVLKYVGAGTEGYIINVEGTDADHPIENVNLTNITINGNGQIFKGGHTESTPAVTDTDPYARGLLIVHANFAKNVNIRDCTFEDIYGDGISFYYSTDIKVINNSLYDVSSGNISNGTEQGAGQTGYDNHGDGISVFFSYNVIIDGNTVINTRKYQSGMPTAIGKFCGRSGLEFEYAVNQNATDENPDNPSLNAPDYETLPLHTIGTKPTRYGVGLIMSNNYVYGYTKGIHLENRIKATICNNTILSNHIGIMVAVHAFTSIYGNHIDTFDIGPCPQVGYDGYYGGIAVSQYARNNMRYGIVVDNNTITGDGKGISIGCDYVTVSNNKISSERGIYTVLGDFNGIKVIGNEFNSSIARHDFTDFVFLYNVKSAEISSNTFYSENFVQNLITGDNIVISKNELVNNGIKNNNGGNNITVRDNLFKGNQYTDDVLFINNGNNSVVDNNTFDITDFNTTDKYIIRFYGGSTNCTLSNNKVSVTSNQENPTIIRFETITNCRIINNRYLNDSLVEFIRAYTVNSCVIEDNYTYSPLAGVIYHTGSFAGCNIVSGNHGDIHGSGYQPNNGLGQMVNNYFQLSQQIYKYNINSSVNSLGWVCTSRGYYVTDVWTTDSSYNANKMIKNSLGNVYKVITKGSGNSTVEPTHTTNTDVTESDGYKWKYLGSVATFKDLTL